MKKIFALLLATAAFAACTNRPKDLSTVTIGMTKTEVTAIVGEPVKKNILNSTEIWDYPDSSRTIVFRKDTVYTIMTSRKARMDSIAIWVDTADNRLERGLDKAGQAIEKAGEKIEDAADRIGDRLKRDSTKRGN